MKFVIAGLVALAGGNAFGSLLLVGPVDLTGTGFGAASTVLTLQSPGNTTIETGCIAPGASGPTTTGCGFMDSNVQPGQSHTGTPTLASLGVASATNLGIIFNADQPGGGAVTIDNLVLNLYGMNSAKSADFSSGSVSFPRTASGIGQSGFLFRLDTGQAATAQSFIDANGGPSSIFIGLGASISNATGGPETFLAANAPGSVGAGAGGGGAGGPVGPTGGSVVPEPQTSALLASGILGLWFLGTRKKHQQ